MHKKQIGYYAATSIVIASMIGTGVFTSLGFQVIGTHSGFALISLWLLGGLLALCGSFSYAQLGVALPGSGGEYNFLSKLYHPALGFSSGFVSATVGFAAPAALSAMALTKYFNKVANVQFNEIVFAVCILSMISALHSINLKLGGKFQTIITFVKVFVITAFIIAGLFSVHNGDAAFGISNNAITDILSPSFAVSMVYVSYSYSGWNASCYLAGEIDNVNKNLPRSLVQGTVIVTVLYVLINLVFLQTVPLNKLEGFLEVGYLSAVTIFGEGGKWMALIIAALLISSISSYILSGPYVAASMGNDHSRLKIFSLRNKGNSPYVSILLQWFISVVLVVTSTFENVLTYVGFTLNLFTFLTVFGLVYKWKSLKENTSFVSPFYPIPSVLFLIVNAWILIFVFNEKPVQSVAGLATAVIGAFIYFAGKEK
jgi:basic amino acid/polyamine antiporter, APA family